MELKYLALASIIPVAIANFMKGRIILKLYDKGVHVERKYFYFIDIPHLRAQDRGDDHEVSQLIDRLIRVTYTALICSAISIGLIIIVLITRTM